MKRPGLLVCLLSGLITLSAVAQTHPTAPPPKPADVASANSGPSLADTMQFVQEKLSDIGKISYVLFMKNIDDGSTYMPTYAEEVSNVAADPSQCRISYDWYSGRGQLIVRDGFGFHEVEDIVVEPIEQYETGDYAANGKPSWVATGTNPPVTALLVRRPHNVVNMLPFYDATVADRVAKALTHAVELCGGGNKDPF